MARKKSEEKRRDVLAALPPDGKKISHADLLLALEKAGNGDSATEIINLSQAREITTSTIVQDDGKIVSFYSRKVDN